jgi:cell division protein FtsB
VAVSRLMGRGETRGFDLKRQLRLSAGPVLAFLVAAYFGYHLVQGDRGLIAFRRIEAEVERLREIRDLAEAGRQCHQDRVNGLKLESLDPDLLEEQALGLRNMGAPGELVILDEPAPRPARPAQSFPGAQ